MSARSRLTFYIGIGFVLIGLLVFFLGPALFASIAYPLPDNFREPMAKRAQEYGLSPNTLAALTFVESGFHMKAHSGAGAIGPTQFLPSTARAVAARLGVSPFSATDLTNNPDLAERFAAYYLSYNLKSYGTLHLALVAYNGGGAAANASIRGYPFPGPESYANKVERIQKAYDAIYGNWWENGTPSQGSNAGPAEPAAPPTVKFEVQPNLNLNVVTSVPVVDLWQGLLSSQQGDAAADTQEGPVTEPGDINNLWKALIPNSS